MTDVTESDSGESDSAGAVVDVAIVGGGPVGLFAALLLERQGLTVAVYERWPTFYPLPRACGIDHEIVRQLQGTGLAADLAPLLDPVIGPDKTYEFLDQRGERLLQFAWNRPGVSGWPQMNMFYQPDLEHLLAARLDASPHVRIHRGRALTGLDQDTDRVALTLAATGDPGDVVIVHARYVIGADGARSTVRDLIGVGQTDLGFEYDWLVVDVVPNEEREWKPFVVQHCDPARPKTLVGSGPGRRRWEFMRLPGETIADLNTAEKAWELLAPSGIRPDNATLERHAVYTFRGSWADEWQRGRVVLAGDAAHLMPPFLGQGLCSGMRDAMALSWRFAAVINDGATPALIASYGPERSGHVQEIIRQAVEMGRLICMLDPVEVAARDEAMKAALRDPSLAVKPPPEPRLGDGGAYLAGDPHAGTLAIQGRVRRDTREGLFDDIVGTGWQLLLRGGEGNGDRAGAAMARLGGVVATFGEGGDTVDVDGGYARWFAAVGADSVLVRPDFYIFGTADRGGVDRLIAAAERLMATGGVGEEPSLTQVAA